MRLFWCRPELVLRSFDSPFLSDIVYQCRKARRLPYVFDDSGPKRFKSGIRSKWGSVEYTQALQRFATTATKMSVKGSLFPWNARFRPSSAAARQSFQLASI